MNTAILTGLALWAFAFALVWWLVRGRCVVNGLTAKERASLDQIREIAENNLEVAKMYAGQWIREATPRRRALRKIATRTIKGLYL